MTSKEKYKVLLTIIISVLTMFGIMTSCKTPPDKLKAKDLSTIKSVTPSEAPPVILTDDEIHYWQTLEFQISSVDYPGETPDFVINLSAENVDFTAIYNKGDKFVFFSFVPEVEYGLFNAPPPGGWTKPLYQTDATEKLLKLIRVR